MNARDNVNSSGIRPLVALLYNNRNLRFWFCQFIGWSGYSLVTFLSITLIDDKVSWSHVGHISLSAVLGILTSWPLRHLYRRTFNLPLSQRVVVASIAVLAGGAVWTALRILVFAWLVGEAAVWGEVHYWYFGSLSVFLSWTVLYYGIKYYELLTLEHQKLLEESAGKEKERFRRLQAESSARDAQLQMLRYQLNPHFLFNTLNAVNALVRLNENSKAQDMLQFLSEFLRHTLEQEAIAKVSLDEELESLMLYLNIEKARFEDRLTVEFDIDSEARQALVPSLILQPILENSMKYAIAESEEGGTVKVNACVLEDKLLLEVSDTGPGMDTTQDIQGRGVGLRNTLERLETLYQGDYSFETLEADPTGLVIRMRFPLEVMPVSQLSVGSL